MRTSGQVSKWASPLMIPWHIEGENRLQNLVVLTSFLKPTQHRAEEPGISPTGLYALQGSAGWENFDFSYSPPCRQFWISFPGKNLARKQKSKIWTWSKFGGFQSPEVRGGEKSRDHQISIFGFMCEEGCERFVTPYLVYSQIWLKLSRDDQHLG